MTGVIRPVRDDDVPPAFRRRCLSDRPLIRTRVIERREYRIDLLSLLGIWIQAFQTANQGNEFGTQFYLQFEYLPGKCLFFLTVLLLLSHADLRGEFDNLAIRLALVLIVFDYADNFLCIPLQLGRIPVEPAQTAALSK